MEQCGGYITPRKRLKLDSPQAHELSSWQKIDRSPQMVCNVRQSNSQCSHDARSTSMNQPWILSTSSFLPIAVMDVRGTYTQVDPYSPNYQACSTIRSGTPKSHHRQALFHDADSFPELKDPACSDQSKALASSIEDEDYMFLDSGTGGTPSSQISAHQHQHALQSHENVCTPYVPPVVGQPTFCHPHPGNSASHIHNHDCFLPQYQPCSLEQCSFDQCFLEPCCFDEDCTLPSECLQHDNDDCCSFADCASAAYFDLSAIPTTLCSSPETEGCHVQEFAYLCNDDDCRIPDRCTEPDLCESIPIIDPLAENKRNTKAVTRKEDIRKTQTDLTKPPKIKIERSRRGSGSDHLHSQPSFNTLAEYRPKSRTETELGPRICLWQTDGAQNICGHVCATADELQEHIIAIHVQALNGRASLVCRWQGCPSAASAKPKNTKTKLIRHMVTHSGCKSPSYSVMRLEPTKSAPIDRGAPCPHCPKVLSNAATLAAHLLTHVPTTAKPTYPCPMCDSVFAHETSLQTHINSQHKNEKRYTCTYEGCSYATADSSNFSKHKKTHEREKNLAVCGVCGAMVSRKNLARHRRDLHPENEEIRTKV